MLHFQTHIDRMTLVLLAETVKQNSEENIAQTEIQKMC